MGVPWVDVKYLFSRNEIFNCICLAAAAVVVLGYYHYSWSRSKLAASMLLLVLSAIRVVWMSCRYFLDDQHAIDKSRWKAR